jgi:hypothetical protein
LAFYQKRNRKLHDEESIALNRMDIGIFIHHFDRHPRSKPQPVHQSDTRIWLSTIYGPDVLTKVEE